MPNAAIANAETSEALGKHVRWYAKLDTAGSTLVQPTEAPFAPGGANGTQRAARMTGTLAPTEHAFAALVLLLDPHAATVLSPPMFGVTFWAKQGSASSSRRVRVSATTRDGTAFGVDILLYDHWSEYTVPFTALKPVTPDAPSLDATRIESIEWRVTGAATPYDVSVDEVTSSGCHGDTRPTSCFAK